MKTITYLFGVFIVVFGTIFAGSLATESYLQRASSKKDDMELFQPRNQILLDAKIIKQNGEIVHIGRAFGWPKTDEITVRISVLPLLLKSETNNKLQLSTEHGEELCLDYNGNVFRYVSEGDTIRRMVSFAEMDELYVVRAVTFTSIDSEGNEIEKKDPVAVRIR